MDTSVFADTVIDKCTQVRNEQGITYVLLHGAVGIRNTQVRSLILKHNERFPEKKIQIIKDVETAESDGIRTFRHEHGRDADPFRIKVYSLKKLHPTSCKEWTQQVDVKKRVGKNPRPQTKERGVDPRIMQDDTDSDEDIRILREKREKRKAASALCKLDPLDRLSSDSESEDNVDHRFTQQKKVCNNDEKKNAEKPKSVSEMIKQIIAELHEIKEKLQMIAENK